MIGDFTWNVMEKDMEGLAKRFKATSRNLANVSTPAYARHNVSFEDQLRAVIRSGEKLQMAVTSPGHIPSRPRAVADVTPADLKVTDEVYRLDGNNVDPEREMAVLAETRMMYGAMNRLASRKLANYRAVISGR